MREYKLNLIEGPELSVGLKLRFNTPNLELEFDIKDTWLKVDELDPSFTDDYRYARLINTIKKYPEKIKKFIADYKPKHKDIYITCFGRIFTKEGYFRHMLKYLEETTQLEFTDSNYIDAVIISGLLSKISSERVVTFKTFDEMFNVIEQLKTSISKLIAYSSAGYATDDCDWFI